MIRRPVSRPVVAGLLGALCAVPALAQTADDLPKTNVQGGYVAQFPTGQARMVGSGLNQAIVTEVLRLDPARLFGWSDLNGPTLETADVVTIVRDVSADAGAVYRDANLNIVADGLPTDLVSETETLYTASLAPFPGSRTVRFVTIVTPFDGVENADACLAGLVRNNFYRGPANADFDAVASSLADS